MAAPLTKKWSAALRTVLRIAAVLVIAYVLHLILTWAVSSTDNLHDEQSGVRIGMLVLMLAVYSLLLAIPFVPGVEIGLALFAMEGAWIAPFVYSATVCGLILAFIAGKHLAYRHLHRIFADLGLARACHLLDSLDPMTEAERLQLLRARLPRSLAGLSFGWRYLLLAVLLNIPGNAVLGGGGGIAMAAGLSGIYGQRLTLLTIVLAVAPVPLAVWLFGTQLAEWLLG